MSIGDFTLLEGSSANGSRGARSYNVATGASTLIINPGEPVTRTVTGKVVQRMYGSATGVAQPVVATDYVVGIAATTSNQTTSVAGTVEVLPTDSNMTWLVTPNDTTAFDTQAEYDALVGHRVLISSDATTYTLLAADSTTSGCVIMPLDIAKHPGKVAVAFRQGLSDVN